MSWNVRSIMRSFSPSSSEIDSLLAKLEKVLGQLKARAAVLKKFPQEDRIKYWGTEVAGLKVDNTVAGAATQDKIPMKDGKVDKETWEKKPEQEKLELWERLDTAFKELRCFNQDELRLGRCYFLSFLILLVATAGIYHLLHKGWLRQSRLSPQETTEVWEQARVIELKLGEIKAKKGEGKEGELKKVSEVKSDLEPLKKSLGKLQSKTQDRGPLTLPFETSRLLGTVSAEIEQNDPTVHQTYQDFLKKLKADLESFSTAYFWTSLPGRWFELAWWAAIGCLVGLLFYISGSLSQGIFRPEEGFMFWAELAIAPIVVPVVFFLFAFTDITSFVPSEVSLTVNVGIAFIFGFAIRRTVGLLDILKKRFFPDPSPGGSSPGS
jgi:hypothetical protein